MYIDIDNTQCDRIHPSLFLATFNLTAANAVQSKLLLFGKIPFTTQSRLLTTLKRRPSENVGKKGENAGNQHFSHFPQCFLPLAFQKLFSFFQPYLLCSSRNAFDLEQPKNFSFGKELKGQTNKYMYTENVIG